MEHYPYKTVKTEVKHFDDCWLLCEYNKNDACISAHLISYKRMIDLFGKKFDKFLESFEIDEDGNISIEDKCIIQSMEAWKHVGLLEGIWDEGLKYSITYSLTAMAAFFVKTKPNRYIHNIDLQNLTFPLIRRVKSYERIINPFKFWNFCVDWFKEHSDCLDRWDQMNIDTEAEACARLADYIISILNEKNVDYAVKTS